MSLYDIPQGDEKKYNQISTKKVLNGLEKHKTTEPEIIIKSTSKLNPQQRYVIYKSDSITVDCKASTYHKMMRDKALIESNKQWKMKHNK